MSIHIPSLPYKLENLPNELLLEIFDYIPLNDLLRVFYNLNARLNSVVLLSNSHLHVLYPDDIIPNSTQKKLLSDFYRRQKYIARLRLSHEKKLLEYGFIQFSQIRSLILDVPTSNHIEMISPEIFPRLEYLRVGYTLATSPLNKLHKYIFSNAFSLLRRCALNTINEYQSWTGSPSLKSLGMWSNNPRLVIERVLFSAMNLKSFHLFLKWPQNDSILDDHIILQHTNLKSLKLHLYGFWTIEKLDSFLAYIPAVKFLELSSSYFDTHMIYFQWNFQQLAYLFFCRLPKISRFDCELIFQSWKKIHVEEICSFHPCFNRIKYETYADNDLFSRVFTDT